MQGYWMLGLSSGYWGLIFQLICELLNMKDWGWGWGWGDDPSSYV